jgi:hypothetical protein
MYNNNIKKFTIKYQKKSNIKTKNVCKLKLKHKYTFMQANQKLNKLIQKDLRTDIRLVSCKSACAV